VADPETRFLGLGKPGRREQPAHESLSSRATLVEVPLTGLSLAHGIFRDAENGRMIRIIRRTLPCPASAAAAGGAA